MPDGTARRTHPRRSGGGTGRRVSAAWLVAALLPLGPAPFRSGVEPAPVERATFMVQLQAPPMATHAGDPAARRHAAFLDAQGRRTLERAGAADAPVLYRYRVAFPGFAARLTPAEAARLAGAPGVARVTPERTFRPAAVEPAEGGGAAPGGLEREGAGFLGLPGGLWARLGGPHRAGEGVVVGVLDTGVYPEHPSFADQPTAGGRRNYDGPAYPPPPGRWRGACQAGEEFPASACNHKLVGARFFVSGFGAGNVVDAEFLSPRDANGHGSHVAATAVGNFGVSPSIAGNDFGIGMVSGIAPRAHLAVYKTCWDGRDGGGGSVDDLCRESDSVAAVEAAVGDGVDVLNVSLGAGPSDVFGPFESALLSAAGAGIFVTGSAGNQGPAPGTVVAPADVPWATSVAASSLPRAFEATATVTGAGSAGQVVVRGASVTGGLERAGFVDAVAATAPGVEAARAEHCLSGALDPGVVAGAAVLCRRGLNERLEKGRAVREAGGVGMVLYNAAPGEGFPADPHPLPSVHVSLADGLAAKRLLAAGPAEVSITAPQAVAAPGDVVASFSSRGPQEAVPDIPKPDLAGPGVGILAAATPTPSRPDRPRESFRLISGTSMSSAHVAGVAALLRQLDPARSPAALKSALMTTAHPTLRTEDAIPAGPFEVGSGRLDPNRAADPGLILDVAVADYVRYLKGVEPQAVPGDVEPIAPSDLNLPAVSYAALTGAATTRRTFTSVDREAGTWRLRVEGLEGLGAVAVPEAFTVGPGQSQEVRLVFAWAGAPLDRYVFGALVLTNSRDGRALRLPVSIRPAGLEPPSREARGAAR